MSDEPLKVLLVDDEHLVRNLLRHCIDWQQEGFHIMGEAGCAHEALEMIREERPDVVFTDIYMPQMDGIELAQNILEEDASIHVVILTGYDEFEYAQKSVEIGVSDFLLKPINDEEILKIVRKLKKEIEDHKLHFQEFDRLRTQLQENLPTLIERQFNEIIMNGIPNLVDLEQKLSYLGIKLQTDIVQVAVMDPQTDPEPNPEQILLLRYQCRDILKDELKDHENVHVFFDNRQRIVMLINSIDFNVDAALSRLKTILIKRLACSISLGCSDRHRHVSKVRQAYREACEAADYHIVLGKNKVIAYQDISATSSPHYQIPQEKLDQLAFSVKANLADNAKEVIEVLCGELGAVRNLHPDTVRISALSVVSTLLDVVDGMAIAMDRTGLDGTQTIEDIFALDTLPEMHDYLIKLTETIMQKIRATRRTKTHQMTEDVKAFVQENLSDSALSLSDTADRFFINRSYLSRIFKQETGLTFVEYITQMRMEKAIEYLRKTDLKAYEIADQVGIENPHYFGTCFKRYTGLTVKDFKKSL